MSKAISETIKAEATRFDFLEGEWNAICRFPLPDEAWGEGTGSLVARKVLDGCVSLEFFEGPYQGTIIKGLSLRAFNPRTSQWEHTWTDTSAPGGFLVWRGRFEGDAIDLTAGGRMRPGTTFSRGSLGLGSRSALPTGRVTAPQTAAKRGSNTG